MCIFSESLLRSGVVELVFPWSIEAGLDSAVVPQPSNHAGQLRRHHTFVCCARQEKQLAGIILSTDVCAVKPLPCCFTSVDKHVCLPPVQHSQNLCWAGPSPWWWPWWTGWCCYIPPLCTACTPPLSSHLHGWFWHDTVLKVTQA